MDIIDGSWKLVKTPGAFSDPRLPKGYAPFGIQDSGGYIFVTYAKQTREAMTRHGKGSRDRRRVLDDGVLLAPRRHDGQAEPPVGPRLGARHGFGKASGALLVGNFGDGYINTFRQDHKGRWKWSGRLLTKKKQPVWIDGLWGIGFGNGAIAGPTTTLYFAAGPKNDESHGLFGAVTADTP